MTVTDIESQGRSRVRLAEFLRGLFPLGDRKDFQNFDPIASGNASAFQGAISLEPLAPKAVPQMPSVVERPSPIPPVAPKQKKTSEPLILTPDIRVDADDEDQTALSVQNKSRLRTLMNGIGGLAWWMTGQKMFDGVEYIRQTRRDAIAQQKQIIETMNNNNGNSGIPLAKSLYEFADDKPLSLLQRTFGIKGDVSVGNMEIMLGGRDRRHAYEIYRGQKSLFSAFKTDEGEGYLAQAFQSIKDDETHKKALEKVAAFQSELAPENSRTRDYQNFILLALAKSSGEILPPSVLRDRNNKYFGAIPDSAPLLYMDAESIKLRMDIIEKMSPKKKAQIADLRENNPEAYAKYLLNCQMIPWTKQSQRGGVKAIMQENLRLAMIDHKTTAMDAPADFKALVAEYQKKSPISRWQRLTLGTGQPPFLDSSKDAKTNGRLLRDHLGSDEKFYAFQVAEGKMTIKEAVTAFGVTEQNQPVFATIRDKQIADLSTSSLSDMKPRITLGDNQVAESNPGSTHIGKKPTTQVPSARHERTYEFMDDKGVYHEGVPESHLFLREINVKKQDGTFEIKKHPEGFIILPEKIPYKNLSGIENKKPSLNDYRSTDTAPIAKAPKSAPIEGLDKIVFRDDRDKGPSSTIAFKERSTGSECPSHPSSPFTPAAPK